jgi:hypothetical protein
MRQPAGRATPDDVTRGGRSLIVTPVMASVFGLKEYGIILFLFSACFYIIDNLMNIIINK